MEYKYKAFISYRRTKRDSTVAQALQKMLEQYVIPAEFCENGRNKLGAIFRDRTHIDADPSLRQIIYDALDSSEFLIVICSEDILDPAHPWVQEEIRYFLKAHPDARNRILTIFAGDSPEASIPRFLWMNDGTQEPELPNYVDIHGKNDRQRLRNLREQLPKLCTSLLSLKNDKLAMREKIRKRRRNVIVAALLSLVIGYLLWSNIQFAKNNRELEQTNQALEQQIDERLLRESELLTQSSVQALASGDQHSAIRDAVDALPSPDSPRPYYAPAEQALYAALDIFNLSSVNHVLRDTVFEQTSTVEDLCFSSDGTKLFSSGAGGSVNCFDVASGTQLWTRTPNQSYGIGHDLILCEPQGSILALSRSSVCSLDMDTGDILWSIEDLEYAAQVELSDDGSCLACLSNDEAKCAMMLTCISTADGSILQTIPVSDFESDFGLIDTNICDFSSDGRYLAGCSFHYIDITEPYFNLFIADLTNGHTIFDRRIYSDSWMLPYSVEFTDCDTTLTFIQYVDNASFYYIASKIRIEDETLLWQTATPEQDFELYAHLIYNDDLLYFEDYLLLGMMDQLYALDAATGELLDTEYLGSYLCLLEKLDQNSFALVLEDGTYRTGEISHGQLWLHENLSSAYDQSSVMNLGPNLNACLGNKGYLRVGDVDAQAVSVISSDDRGPCCVAFVPQDNDWQVIVRKAIPFAPPLEKKSLYAYDPSGGNYFNFGFLSADTFYLDDGSYNGTTLFFDRRTLEQTVPESGDIRFPSYDFTQEPELDRDYNILLADDSILTATPTENCIKLRLDGKPLPDAVYPDAVRREPSYNIARSIFFGRNGYILLDTGTKYIGFSRDTYHLYDIRTQQWYQIPAQKGDNDGHLICLGEKKPTFTVMDQSGILRTYDIPSGEEIQHIDTGLHHNDFSNIQWIMDDRYLLAYTDILQYFFLDGVTGEILFRYTAKTDNHAYTPHYASDPQRSRFFIWNDIGVCIDTENWAVLTEIPGMELYDPASGMLFFQDSTTTTDFEEYISAIRLPTTEELVAIGKAYLGE